MEPMIEIAGARVFLGDCVEVMKSLPDNSVDSVVTDPPYGLEFMGKEWDAPWKKSGSFNGNIEETAESAGGVSKFANHRVRYQKGLAPMLGFQLWATEWAVECLRVLKPGGHILAFGGSRTWHRLAVAVEDAGFELRDSIAWIYGSGFPKSLDVSKAIDKRAGAEREVVGTAIRQNAIFAISGSGALQPQFANGSAYELKDKPATLEAKEWQGWGTALKPAFEPVVVGRKPLVGTVAENVLQWGVGGLNIDGSRITVDPNDPVNKAQYHNKPNAIYGKYADKVDGNITSMKPHEGGRWPANVILDEVSAGLLDEQSGATKSANGGGIRKTALGRMNDDGWQPKETEMPGYGDSGGASRFFYVAKASKRDRNEGLEELEKREFSDRKKQNHFTTICGKHHTQRDVCKCEHVQMVTNFHPTVKPTQLMRYLIKLVTPAGGVVLDPFTGSGSTGKAALLDGYRFIGAELTEEYLPIIEGRLRWASEQEGEDDDTLF